MLVHACDVIGGRDQARERATKGGLGVRVEAGGRIRVVIDAVVGATS